MSGRCEDFRAAGIRLVTAPQYTKTGRLKCTCGKPLPQKHRGYEWRSSICPACMEAARRREEMDSGLAY